MQCSSGSDVVQSSSPTLTTLSTVTVSSFSCKNIKKVDSNICIAPIATDKQSNYNQQCKIITTSQITIHGSAQSEKIEIKHKRQ
jgi:hypothetical protein